MPASIKTEVWKELLETLFAHIKAPITCGLAVYGKLPFFQELRNRLHEQPYSNVPGIKYVTVDIEGTHVHAGPFKTNEPHALEEELSDARIKLPDFQPHYEELITFAIKQAHHAGTKAALLTESLLRAKLLLEFSQSVAHARTLEQALTLACQFIVSKFKLSNALLTANGKTARYYDLVPSALLAEQKIIAQIKESNSPIIVQNSHADILFSSIKDIKNAPPCMIGLPINRARTTIGHTVLYAEHIPHIENITEVLFELALELERLNEYEKAQENATTDSLTGLHNRAELATKANAMLSRLSSQNQPISILMIDADNFKKYNDTKGHVEGDNVLKLIAHIVKQSTPEHAFACRYGGEEFTIVIPGADQTIAKDFAEKLRTDVEQSGPLTISIGICTCMNSTASLQTLLKEADAQLYRAKHLGKNRVAACVMIDKNLGAINI